MSASLLALSTLGLVGLRPIMAAGEPALVRVSVSSNGSEGYGDSAFPSISADGRYVVFHTLASGQVSNPLSDPQSAIVLRDRQTKQTKPVARGLNGAAADGPSYTPAISGNGQYVAFDSYATNLVPGDTNNGVVLYKAPLSIGMAASRVFGQPDFTSSAGNQGGAPSAASFYFPSGVAVDGVGTLYVADYNNNRVLGYDAPLTGDTTADVVVGQPSFTTTGGNQNKGQPDATTLANPMGLAIGATGTLYVSDTGNDRVLVYVAVRTTDRIADLVLGQTDFITNDAFFRTGSRVNTFDQPFGVAVDAVGSVYVADTHNNRVVVYGTPLSTDTNSDQVFGQAGQFTENAAGPASARTLHAPTGIAFDSAANIYIVDRENSRVLAYNHMTLAPFPTLAATDPSALAIGRRLTLAAIGQDFVEGGRIRIDGVAAPSQFTDSTRLTTVIDSTSDLGVGTIPITVIDPDSCTGVSNSVDLTVNPQRLFLPVAIR